MNNSEIKLITLIIFLLLTSSTFSQIHFDRSEWSGHASVLYRTYLQSKSSGVNELDNWEMEATISNGVGLAKTTLNREFTGVYKAHDGTMITETEKGEASGSDTTALFVSFNDEKGTYSISIKEPRASGKLTTITSCNTCDSRPRVSDYGTDGPGEIAIDDQKLQGNGNILKGQITETDKSPGGTEYTTIMNWEFHRIKKS